MTTTAGPEPDWYFDPDGGENERYWNGVEWTQHRRSRRSTVNQPPGSFSNPGDIVDSMSGSTLDGRHQAGTVLEDGVGSQDPPPTPQQLERGASYDLGYQHGRAGQWTGPARPIRPTEKPVPRRRRSSVAYYLFVVLAVISAGLDTAYHPHGTAFSTMS